MNPIVILALLGVVIGAFMDAVSPTNKHHKVISSIGIAIMFFGAFMLGNQIGR